MKEKSKGNGAHKKFIITGVLSVEHDGNEKVSSGEKQDWMFRSPNKA